MYIYIYKRVSRKGYLFAKKEYFFENYYHFPDKTKVPPTLT